MRIALLLALALLLAVSGCGSDANDDTPGNAPPPTTTKQEDGGSYNYP